MELDQLGELVGPERSEPHGRIRAVATPIGLTYMYWPICERFLQSRPPIDLAFQDVELPANGPRMARAGAADVAFAALPVPGTGSQLNTLAPWARRVDSGGPSRPPVSRGAAGRAGATETRTDGSVSTTHGYPRVREPDWLSQLGDHPASLETGDVEYLKRLVMLGRGITALPWPAVAEEIEAGKLARVGVQAANIVQEFGLVYGSGRIPRAVRALVDFCRAWPLRELLAR